MIRNLKRYPNPKNTTKCNQLKIIIFNSIRSLWKPFKQNLNPNTIIWADFSSGHFLKFYQSATVINLMTDGLKFISTENGSIWIEWVIQCWRGKQNLNFTTDKQSSIKFTQKTSAGLSPMGELTLWFMPNHQCLFTRDWPLNMKSTLMKRPSSHLSLKM
jgi:hypothetical protein